MFEGGVVSAAFLVRDETASRFLIGVFLFRESTSSQLRSTQNEATDFKMQTCQLKAELRNLRFENIRSGNDYSVRLVSFAT